MYIINNISIMSDEINNTTVTKKIVRRTKNEIFSHEQDIVIAKMFKVIQPWLFNKNSIKSIDLNENEDFKNALITLIPEYLKFYNFAHATLINRWRKDQNSKITRFSTAIIKEIIKPKGIKLFSVRSRKNGSYAIFDLNGYVIKDLNDNEI